MTTGNDKWKNVTSHDHFWPFSTLENIFINIPGAKRIHQMHCYLQYVVIVISSFLDLTTSLAALAILLIFLSMLLRLSFQIFYKIKNNSKKISDKNHTKI